jgi:hypothetical protein
MIRLPKRSFFSTGLLILTATTAAFRTHAGGVPTIAHTLATSALSSAGVQGGDADDLSANPFGYTTTDIKFEKPEVEFIL